VGITLQLWRRKSGRKPKQRKRVDREAQEEAKRKHVMVSPGKCSEGTPLGTREDCLRMMRQGIAEQKGEEECAEFGKLQSTWLSKPAS